MRRRRRESRTKAKMPVVMRVGIGFAVTGLIMAVLRTVVGSLTIAHLAENLAEVNAGEDDVDGTLEVMLLSGEWLFWGTVFVFIVAIGLIAVGILKRTNLKSEREFADEFPGAPPRREEK